MAEYDIDYMKEHCIDVYFKNGNKPIHILTYGTIIPQKLNNVERNRRLQHLIAVDQEAIAEGVEVAIQRGYVLSVYNNSYNAIEEKAQSLEWMPSESKILQMFVSNAQLGFYSYDCVEELEDGRGLYKLVTYPQAGNATHQYELVDFDEIEVVEEEEGIVTQFRM